MTKENLQFRCLALLKLQKLPRRVGETLVVASVSPLIYSSGMTAGKPCRKMPKMMSNKDDGVYDVGVYVMRRACRLRLSGTMMHKTASSCNSSRISSSRISNRRSNSNNNNRMTPTPAPMRIDLRLGKMTATFIEDWTFTTS